MGGPGGAHATEAGGLEAGHCAGAVAERVAHPAWRAERLVEADRHGKDAGQLGVGDEVGRRQRLLNAQDVIVRQAAQDGDVLLPCSEGPVRVDLEHEVGMIGAHRAHRVVLPTGLDLHAHPRRPSTHRGVDVGSQRGQIVTRRNADDRTHRQRLEPSTRPEGLRHRTTLGTQFGVGHRHLEGRRHHPVHRRAREELGHERRCRQLPVPRGAGRLESGHAALDHRQLHLLECGVDRGRIGQGGTLAPPLARIPHDPDEEERSHPVYARGGPDVTTERDVDPDQLHSGELHRERAPTPPP